MKEMRYYPSPLPLPPSDRVETSASSVTYLDASRDRDGMMPLRKRWVS